VTHASTVEIRFRAKEAGNRSNDVTSEGQRLVMGLEGRLGGWDYTVAASHAANKVADRYVNGYFLFNEFATALRNGEINPFGASTAAGQAKIASLRVNDVARRSEGSTSGVDAKISSSLGKIDGREVGVALGVEFKREDQSFTPSPLLVSNNIAGDRDSTGTSPPLVATSQSRNISSAYAEVNVPLQKNLEVQAALRGDHYEGVGSSVNPKLGVRWQPSNQVVVRGSAGAVPSHHLRHEPGLPLRQGLQRV
jgi:iron complex outermembrane receptor protein